MEVEVINFKEKCDLIKRLHEYKIIAKMNNYYFKLIRVKREFVWHKHPETDEVFIIISGTMEIELRDKTLFLKEGDMVVIPKDVEHKPTCREECCCLLIEPVGTLNTGDAGGDMTVKDEQLEWI